MMSFAKPGSDFMQRAVLYQLVLRAFTQEGTLAAAERLLPRVAESGATILYLSPIALADTDGDPAFWSERQIRSGCGNPRSPYRLADYDTVDPEYGTPDDLKRFVRSAHALGLKVLLDLVYYHCGPGFAARHPAFIRQNPDGTAKNGLWRFPELDFSLAPLREFLWRNMGNLVREFDVDGFRCDVGIRVPLDFWAEGKRRAEAVKPDLLFLCEGELERPEDQRVVFDGNYSFTWSTCVVELFRGNFSAPEFETEWRKQHDKALRGARFLRAFDTHDIANDVEEARFEAEWGSDAVDAALVLSFTFDGIPFVYNGYEDNDTARHSIFSHPGQHVIDRSHADPARMAHLRALAALRKTCAPLFRGELVWSLPSDAPRVVRFSRTTEDESVVVIVNAAPDAVELNDVSGLLSPSDFLLQKHCTRTGETSLRLGPYGFVLYQSQSTGVQ